MQVFDFKINVAAENKEVAKDKVKAALSMINNLQDKQLFSIAHFVERCPEQVSEITELLTTEDKTAVLTKVAKMAAEEMKNGVTNIFKSKK